MDKNYFETIDLQLAAFFMAKGLDYIEIVPSATNPHLKSIHFPRNEALILEKQYEENGEVPVKSIFNQYARVRDIVLPPRILTKFNSG